MLCANGYEHVLKMSFHQMFEHMKNYEVLMRKVASWLKPNAKAAGGEALVFVSMRLPPYRS